MDVVLLIGSWVSGVKNVFVFVCIENEHSVNSYGFYNFPLSHHEILAELSTFSKSINGFKK